MNFDQKSQQEIGPLSSNNIVFDPLQNGPKTVTLFIAPKIIFMVNTGN